jgi:3-phenylpropionate/trans-cinnamate dioxygenase ferredoxin subunit
MTTAAQTSGYTHVAKVNDIPAGAMTGVKVGERDILIARVGDKFYAARNVCPHMGARLSLGKLDGTVITCPRHRSRFDLVDGRIIRWTDWTGIKASVSKLFKSPRPITLYPVLIEDGEILVKLE